MRRIVRASWPSPVSDIDVPAVLLAAVRLYDPFALYPEGARVLAMGDEGGNAPTWLDIELAA